MAGLAAIGGDMSQALEAVNVPSYVVDTRGVVRWLNRAAVRVVGDVRGQQFTSVVAAEDKRRAREAFARKIAGTAKVTDTAVTVVGADGDRVSVELSSVPLLDGNQVVGVFGQCVDREPVTEDPAPDQLTPRQTEVLRLLARGYSTHQIADELHLSPETVRNHIRHLLQALGVHSRLEAVAFARADQLVGAAS